MSKILLNIKLQFIIISCSFFSIHAQQTNTQAAQSLPKNNIYKALQLAPGFESPVISLPSFYLEKNQTCTVDSTYSDSTGAIWSHVSTDKKTGWVSAGVIRISSIEQNDSNASAPIANIPDIDKIRRSHLAFQHQEWSRRIQKAVRDGKICLEMATDQLVASWGEPFQKGAAFLSGFGNHEIWIYKDKDGKVLLVFLADNKIIGWSL
jgi:hypothetical protein